MLLYFSNVPALSREVHPDSTCDVLLVYSMAVTGFQPPQRNAGTTGRTVARVP